eukprot:TRINITY_DN1749_c0_g1_i3.p1 TRINITY_DN1749_c0_g1~~TRINITY_DN1749_c0_g1_i3.p1  ORF type:complete len:127 (-),score=11.82 TRINITY_DN1749_c0_g1_i3:399-779(-)
MKELVEMIDNEDVGRGLPHIKNVYFLRNFLESCDYDSYKAFLHVSKYVSWREEIGIGKINFEQIREELETGKLSMPMGKLDRDGNPIIIFVSRLHFPSVTPTLLLVTAMTYIKFVQHIVESRFCFS